MSYSVFILKKAQKELAKLPHKAYEPVKEAIRQLGENPRPEGCLKLVSREGWKIRIRDYRVIYEIIDLEKQVNVLHIGHRRDVYR